ncbi:hypothetical protein B4145_3829 [Bacillus subtilis]|uniref:Uncharacterized protein n=1 Tax=Bacillus subtilis subsp. subtilis TaxID=135461 RepID=A0ABD3ZUW1_BACIU|nr:hypothetical protein B4067_3910 [Bacillus subtilis subsp. subtilis]KIN59418.1 hypothetical protein B4145_3829 [Bacillus subtilis]
MIKKATLCPCNRSYKKYRERKETDRFFSSLGPYPANPFMIFYQTKEENRPVAIQTRV